MHNKRTGISVFHHNSGTEIQCDPDGSYTITGKSGATARCDTEGNFTFKGTSMKVVADEDIDMQATRIKLTAVNGLDINAGAIDINGKTNLNMTSPMVKFNGTKCEFSMNSVVVDNTFQLIKGGTYKPIISPIDTYNNGIKKAIDSITLSFIQSFFSS